jgi:hypothetical protein
MTREIDPQLLRKLLRYEPETGKLFWLERGPDLVKPGRNGREIEAGRFNSRYGGSEALAHRSHSGYLTGAIFGRAYFAHRIAWVIQTGKWPEHSIDHINGRRDDNRFCNLRCVDADGNARNAKRRRDNSSGRTGVYWRKDNSCWQASIRVDRKTIGLGCFSNFDDAVAARLAGERLYGFHPNHGRAA